MLCGIYLKLTIIFNPKLCLIRTTFKTYLEIDLLYGPAIPLLDIYSDKTKAVYQRVICTSVSIPVEFTTTRKWNECVCLLAVDWIRKM